MRIAVMATNRNPLREPYAGGQESVTAALVRGFRKSGHEVVLYAAAGTPDTLADELVTYPTLPRLSQVAALDPQVPEKPFLDDHHAFTAAVADLAPRTDIDVIANHSLHHLPLSLSKLLPAPVVTTLHTPPFPWLELGAALAAPSARYVAVSSAVAQQWQTLSCEVIPNGVQAPVLPRADASVAAGPPQLVWAGRITAEKAPHVALGVAKRLGWPLTVAGPIADRTYWETHLAPQLNALEGSALHYAGALATDDLMQLFARATVAVMTPVWDEPFGMVAVEAAMCGTPVVALQRGGVAEAVLPQTGMLVPDAVAEPAETRDDVRITRLAQAVQTLVEAQQHGQFRPDEVAAAARAHFGVETWVNRHLAVLADACGQAATHQRPDDTAGKTDRTGRTDGAESTDSTDTTSGADRAAGQV